MSAARRARFPNSGRCPGRARNRARPVPAHRPCRTRARSVSAACCARASPIPGPSPATVSTSTAPIDNSPATIRDQPSPSSLPTGTVTFLFTDLVGSTRLWERHPQAMQRALEDATQLRPRCSGDPIRSVSPSGASPPAAHAADARRCDLLVYILVVSDCLLGVWLLVLAWR